MMQFRVCLRPPKIFMFSDMWVLNPMFEEILKSSFLSLPPCHRLFQLKKLFCSLKGPLQHLNRSKFAGMYAQQIRVRS